MAQDNKAIQLKAYSQMENKYNKAIKQISKLVSVNTAAKKQIYSLKQICKDKQNKVEILEVQNQKLTKRYEELRKKTNPQMFTMKKKSIQLPIKESQKQLQQTGSISEYIDARKRYVQLEQKLSEQKNSISSLQRKLEESAQQNFKLKQTNTQQKLQIQKSRILIQKQKCQQRVLNDWINKLNEQCQDLKKKILGQDKELITQKSNMSSFALFTPQHKRSSFFSDNDPQYILRQKVNSLTLQNKKMEEKFKTKKEKLYLQIQQLREENKNLSQKFDRIMIFMDKQQKYIQTFQGKI